MARRPELKGRAARLARLFPTGPGQGRGGTQAARTPFVLLVVLLLGGGLIGLLVLNSALSEGTFRLDDLERETKALTDEEQALRRDIDAYAAPAALQARARELGMVPGGDPAFLNPDGTVKGVPAPARGTRYRPLVLAPESMPTGATAVPETAPATTEAAATATKAAATATEAGQAGSEGTAGPRSVPQPQGAPVPTSAAPPTPYGTPPEPTPTPTTPGR
ncbi:septum formation initiator family protein [Streptomyces sp. NPDC006997]|uniref:septum formation initiator family protein n=1 Tax=Streptomyces sp. NPDC006997 TaxID=3155356 RepID=UPI0033C00276